MMGHEYWRIICIAEDGSYIVNDGFGTRKHAIEHLRAIEADYGEGQRLYVESYERD